jgi:hypothetical protein
MFGPRAWQGDQVQLDLSNMHLAMKLATMAKGGFSCATRQETQYLIKKPRANVEEEKKPGVEFPGDTKVQAGIEDTGLCFIKTTWPDAFLGTKAPKKIHRHARDTNKQVHLHAIDADSRLRSRHHICPDHHPPQLLIFLYLNFPESLFYWPDKHSFIYLFPMGNLLLLVLLLRIASTLEILIQIC